MNDRGWDPTSMPRRETQHSYGYPSPGNSRQAGSAAPRSSGVVNARRELAEQAAISVRVDDSE